MRKGKFSLAAMLNILSVSRNLVSTIHTWTLTFWMDPRMVQAGDVVVTSDGAEVDHLVLEDQGRSMTVNGNYTSTIAHYGKHVMSRCHVKYVQNTLTHAV